MSNGTNGDSVRIPGWMWSGGVIVALLFLTGGIGTWVGATLLDNGKLLVDHEGRIRRVESDYGRLFDKLDKVLERLERP